MLEWIRKLGRGGFSFFEKLGRSNLFLLKTLVGIHDHEKIAPQRIIINVDLMVSEDQPVDDEALGGERAGEFDFVVLGKLAEVAADRHLGGFGELELEGGVARPVGA